MKLVVGEIVFFGVIVFFLLVVTIIEIMRISRFKENIHGAC